MNTNEENFIQPKLYILMRNDIPDLSPGKACAQAAHAANDFMRDMEEQKNNLYSKVYCEYKNWLSEGKSFGTTIVLDANLTQLEKLESWVDENFDRMTYRNITDNTYPITNYYGKHYTVETLTCSWFFAYTEEQTQMVSHLKLYPGN